jgi:hypothetical protein
MGFLECVDKNILGIPMAAKVSLYRFVLDCSELNDLFRTLLNWWLRISMRCENSLLSKMACRVRMYFLQWGNDNVFSFYTHWKLGLDVNSWLHFSACFTPSRILQGE